MLNDLISRQAAIDALKRAEALTRAFGYHVVIDTIRELPSAQPQTEWNNHTVACLLAELFGDACPNPVGVACWEQYLKHRAERRTDEQ